MSNPLRRRLQSLQRLAQRPGTAGEGIAAELAIARIRARLQLAGEEMVWDAPDSTLHSREGAQGTEHHYPSDDPRSYQPQPKRRARRKAAHERPKQQRIKVGDILDCADSEGTFARCRCGCQAMQVTPSATAMAAGLLVCVQCRRARKRRREHFEQGGRWAD